MDAQSRLYVQNNNDRFLKKLHRCRTGHRTLPKAFPWWKRCNCSSLPGFGKSLTDGSSNHLPGSFWKSGLYQTLSNDSFSDGSAETNHLACQITINEALFRQLHICFMFLKLKSNMLIPQVSLFTNNVIFLVKWEGSFVSSDFTTFLWQIFMLCDWLCPTSIAFMETSNNGGYSSF